MGFFLGEFMFSLLSYGEVLVDFLPDDENKHYCPMAGGAPANVAVAYAKLAGKSYFAGGIGDDNFGEMLLEQLQSEGVNTDYTFKFNQTNTALVLVSLDTDGERSFSFYRNDTADTRYDAAQINEINWNDLDIFHYCSNTLTNTFMYNNTFYAIEKARANHLLVSFDVNLRQQIWDDIAVLPSAVQSCIQKSDIVKLSREEADYLAIAEKISYESYMEKILSVGVKLIVVTNGPDDVHVISRDFSKFIPVPRITAVDTTAAGDSFIAGFLYCLTTHASQNQYNSLFNVIEDIDVVTNAVFFAAKCGALTCKTKGAFTALPSITDVSN